MSDVARAAIEGEAERMHVEPAALKVVDYAIVNKELNAEARAIRTRIAMRWDPGDLTEYIRCWSEDDVIDNRPCKALVVILKTRGCTWALAGGCTMCGYANESAWTKVGVSDLVAQFTRAWRKYQGEELVKIYTSGSFLDRFEVPQDAQRQILALIGRRATPDGVAVLDPSGNPRSAPVKVAFESLPGFVTDENLAVLGGLVERLEIGIGVESSNDVVLRDSINKGHPFSSFGAAAAACQRHGVSVKAYLMCKPPFLKESDALVDSTQTIIAAAPHSQMVSLNPTNVQGNTLVDALYKRGSYRPPWLWTLVQALLDGRTQAEENDAAAGRAPGSFMLKSDVIAAGKSRGAHNCGKCDETVAGYLKKYKATQDRKWLARCMAEVECVCRGEWELTLQLGPLVPGYSGL